MNRQFVTRPLLKTGILGLLMLPFLVLINEFSPPKEKVPEDYSSTIVAFEFASNTAELNEVLLPLSAEERKDLDRLNYVDFGFMVIYGIFLFLFMSSLGQLHADYWLKRARWLATIIVLSDALENVQLLKLTNIPSADLTNINDTLFLLALFTWTKWLLLALAFSVIGYRMTLMSRSNRLSYVLFIPGLLGIVAFLHNGRAIENIFATSVFGGFLVLFIYCLIYRVKPI